MRHVRPRLTAAALKTLSCRSAALSPATATTQRDTPIHVSGGGIADLQMPQPEQQHQESRDEPGPDDQRNGVQKHSDFSIFLQAPSTKNNIASSSELQASRHEREAHVRSWRLEAGRCSLN